MVRTGHGCCREGRGAQSQPPCHGAPGRGPHLCRDAAADRAWPRSADCTATQLWHIPAAAGGLQGVLLVSWRGFPHPAGSQQDRAELGEPLQPSSPCPTPDAPFMDPSPERSWHGNMMAPGMGVRRGECGHHRGIRLQLPRPVVHGSLCPDCSTPDGKWFAPQDKPIQLVLVSDPTEAGSDTSRANHHPKCTTFPMTGQTRPRF